MAPQNILLFGATGQIGSFILDAILSARDQFTRVAIFTSPRTAETKAPILDKLKQQNVEVIIGDVEDENAIKAAYEGKTPTIFPYHPSRPSKMLTHKHRSRHRHLSPRPHSTSPANPPHPPRSRQPHREMVPALRVRHGHRIQPGLGAREAAPAET